MASRANMVVEMLDDDEFVLYSQLRHELEQHYDGRQGELRQLLGEAGLGEALLRAAMRAEQEAATLKEAAQEREACASRYRRSAHDYLYFSGETPSEQPQELLLAAR